VGLFGLEMFLTEMVKFTYPTSIRDFYNLSIVLDWGLFNFDNLGIVWWNWFVLG